jgi:hypothetical protein
MGDADEGVAARLEDAHELRGGFFMILDVLDDLRAHDGVHAGVFERDLEQGTADQTRARIAAEVSFEAAVVSGVVFERDGFFGEAALQAATQKLAGASTAIKEGLDRRDLGERFFDARPFDAVTKGVRGEKVLPQETEDGVFHG